MEVELLKEDNEQLVTQLDEKEAEMEEIRGMGPKNAIRLVQEHKSIEDVKKENARGRFLKVSETFTRVYSRFQIIIPADGMEEFGLHLKELIEECDGGEIEEAQERFEVDISELPDETDLST